MRLDNHSFIQIKSVCVESFDVRNEFYLAAFFLFGEIYNPIKQFAAVAFGPFAASRNEVLDFEKLAARKPFGDSKSADGFYFSVRQIG